MITDLKGFLLQKAEQFETTDFIPDDPISIPHEFVLKEDIEISGFFAAIIAWGNRKSIINDANKIMNLMGNAPYDFIINHKKSDLKITPALSIHRTFMQEDLFCFFKHLQRLYQNNQSLESLFSQNINQYGVKNGLTKVKEDFLLEDINSRTKKHLPSPLSGSAAKRINMYLRWMVRNNKKNVDFGIWKSISSSKLYIPLDVHTANVSRKLGMLKRKQNDWKALEELMIEVRDICPNDPSKLDFALFGLGAIEKFNK